MDLPSIYYKNSPRCDFISAKVLIHCFWRIEIYLTNAVLLLVCLHGVVIVVARKQLATLLWRIDVPRPSTDGQHQNTCLLFGEGCWASGMGQTQAPFRKRRDTRHTLLSKEKGQPLGLSCLRELLPLVGQDRQGLGYKQAPGKF